MAVKIKGTTAALEECRDWFLSHPHLQVYVRHIEYWVPVWEKRVGQRTIVALSGTMTFEQHARPHAVVTVATPNTAHSNEQDSINQAYQLASHNATLEEIFGCTSTLFSNACIMTIEGGHCKKPPMIQQFRSDQKFQTWASELPLLTQIRTLVLKGAWNIIRGESDFRLLAAALPNLHEWHCTYAKPKTKAYQTICSVVQHFPPTLSHVNICLEGFYSKDTTSSSKWRQLYPETHLCKDLSRILPQLEALTFTGRVCGCLFSNPSSSPVNNCNFDHHPTKTQYDLDPSSISLPMHHHNESSLKSLDLIVKNCCREISAGWNDGTGIHNWNFIKAFEALVTSAVYSLSSTHPDLTFLRIRFIDLDSPCLLLNPYFLLQNNKCTGVWNEEILAALGVGRPGARFAELMDDCGSARCNDLAGKDGRILESGWPRTRPRSIKLSSYKALAGDGGNVII